MSINGISSAGSTYNFTNMTPQQLLSAGGQLFNEGKITSQENVALMGMACAYAPGPGGQLPASLGLDSTTGQNFVAMLQNNIAELDSFGSLDAGEQNSLTGDQGLLQVMDTYQSPNATAAPSQETTGTLLNQQA